MEKLLFKAGGETVPIHVDRDSGMIYTLESCCTNKVRQGLSRLIHNPLVTADSQGVYLAIPNPSLKLTPQGERIASQVQSKAKRGEIKTNPLSLYIMILGSLFGVAVLCSKMPGLSFCKALGDAFWEVLFPITSFSFAGLLGVKLGEALAG